VYEGGALPVQEKSMKVDPESLISESWGGMEKEKATD